MARLSDICSIKGGYAFKSEEFSDEGIPVIRIGNITEEGLKIDTKTCYEESFWEDNENYRVNTNDILVAMSGATVGKSCINDHSDKLLLNQRVASISGWDGVVNKYIYYFVSSPVFMNYILEQSVGCAQPNISIKQLSAIDLYLPNLNQQNQIVEKLDKVSFLIEQRKQQLLKLDELVKSRFVEMFGHQGCNERNMAYGKIDDVAEIYLGLTHTPTYMNEGVKFISAKNTSCDYLDLSDVKYISREEFESAPIGAKPQKGDVLFSRVGSNLGHPVILDIDEEFCTFVSLGFLRTKGKVTNLYLKHWMRDDFFAEQVAQKVVGGGQPNLNTGWLKEFKIIIPPISLQNEFAAFVEQTDKSKLSIQQSLENLETLKKSLMQQYFG